MVELKTGKKYYFEKGSKASPYYGYAIGLSVPRILFYDLNVGVEFGRFERMGQRVELSVTSMFHLPVALKVSYGIGF